jgi:hypothetical protein
MTCNEVQKILIDQTESVEKIDKDEMIMNHIQNCSACRQFRNDLKELRLKIMGLRSIDPPPNLFEMTLERCHRELDNLEFSFGPAHSVPELTKIPGYIWILLPLALIVSLLWIFPEIKGLVFSQNFTWTSIVILFILFENFLMLILTPILLRSQKSPLNLQMSFINNS